MKLKDPFAPLDDLRRRISAPKTNERFGDDLLETKRKLEKEGVEVNIQDLENVGPFLTYKGLLVVAYILDSNVNAEELRRGQPESRAPKFHFTTCKTLEEMNRKGRIERYVSSTSKTGLFRVSALENDRRMIRKYGKRHMLEQIRLFPCQNCLNKINYRGFNLEQPKKDRLKKVNEFSILDYLEENEGNLTTINFFLKNIEEKPLGGGGYKDNFPETSRRLRKEARWRCSKCAVDMTEKKQGLHVHHKNGVKNDDRHSNLQVLCALCHQRIDQYHKRMHVSEDIIRYIRRNRP